MCMQSNEYALSAIMHHGFVIHLITNVQSFYSLTTGISGGCNKGIVDESRLVWTDSDTNTDSVSLYTFIDSTLTSVRSFMRTMGCLAPNWTVSATLYYWLKSVLFAIMGLFICIHYTTQMLCVRILFLELITCTCALGVISTFITSMTKRVGKPRYGVKSHVCLFRVLLLCLCFSNIASVKYDYVFTITNEIDSDTYSCTTGSTTCNLRGALDAANAVKPSPSLITFGNGVSAITMRLNEFGPLLINASSVIDIRGPSNRTVSIQPSNINVVQQSPLFLANQIGAANLTMSGLYISNFNLEDASGAVLNAYNGNGDNGPLYLNVTRVRIEDVRANDGGGFSLNNCVDCAIADTVFKRSIANKKGGAMYLNQYNTNFQFFNVSFEQCSAADNGGG